MPILMHAPIGTFLHIFGICYEASFQVALGVDQSKVASILSKLEAAYAIFPCGVDERRYVTKENIHCWLVQNADSSFVPKPWILPSGEVNFPVLR